MKKINVINMDTGKCINVLKGHSCEIWDLQLTANDKNNQLISCSEDKLIKIWDLDNGVCLKTLVVGLTFF